MNIFHSFFIPIPFFVSELNLGGHIVFSYSISICFWYMIFILFSELRILKSSNNILLLAAVLWGNSPPFCGVQLHLPCKRILAAGFVNSFHLPPGGVRRPSLGHLAFLSLVCSSALIVHHLLGRDDSIQVEGDCRRVLHRYGFGRTLVPIE